MLMNNKDVNEQATSQDVFHKGIESHNASSVASF